MVSSPSNTRVPRQDAEDRRRELLAATISCLARLGSRATTGREICREAGVSHGLLRHYFSSPENLLLETYQDLCNRFLRRFEEEVAAPMDDPLAGMDRFFAVLFSEEWSSAEILGAWTAFWSLGRTNPEFVEVYETFNGKFRRLLEVALARLPCPAEGVARADAVEILSAVMDGLWLDLCLSPSRPSRERASVLCSLTLRQLTRL
ncbi:MAG TPA: TetR family transcriptional regulator C-terminal domain-containing protein [Sphingomonadaceae bacterium]|nr:TetR family transcriptional regulator C-terminal domain-containing protein [Sphingomonadaceae bacterium]